MKVIVQERGLQRGTSEDASTIAVIAGATLQMMTAVKVKVVAGIVGSEVIVAAVATGTIVPIVPVAGGAPLVAAILKIRTEVTRSTGSGHARARSDSRDLDRGRDQSRGLLSQTYARRGKENFPNSRNRIPARIHRSSASRLN